MFIYFFKKSKFVFAILSLSGLFIYSNYSLADYMQGTVYRMQSDSLNFGGQVSSSSTYKIDDSLGEVATGDSNSANYYMHAGFWQMQESYISISNPSDLVMDSMAGLSGGSSEGLMSWIVTTDNTAGYNLSIASLTSPALSSLEDSLNDYTPAGSDPDFNFYNDPTESSFGFSPEGNETISRFRDNGSLCNTGSLETTGKCWDGLSTTPKVIAGGTSSNTPSGATVTVRFRAESGVDHIQTSGEYNVTIVVTAVTL